LPRGTGLAMKGKGFTKTYRFNHEVQKGFAKNEKLNHEGKRFYQDIKV
jgi:hypothetical protein